MNNSLYESNYYDISFRGIVNEYKKIDILTNKTNISVDSTINFDIENEKISSIEYFATAILSDLLFSIINFGKKSNVYIDDLEGKIDITVSSPLSLLNVKGYDDLPNIEKINIIIYLYLDVETENEFILFCEKAIEISYIYNLLKTTGKIELNFKRVN